MLDDDERWHDVMAAMEGQVWGCTGTGLFNLKNLHGALLVWSKGFFLAAIDCRAVTANLNALRRDFKFTSATSLPEVLGLQKVMYVSIAAF